MKRIKTMQRAKSKQQRANSKEQILPFAICLLSHTKKFFLFCLLQFTICPFINAQTLSLQDAVNLAVKNYPTIQQATLQTQQQKALTGTATILDPFNINTGLGQINSKLFDYNVGVAQGFKLLCL